MALALFSCEGDRTLDPRPNVIVIVADDAGYADFGFMGSTDLETPNLDQLAKNGTIFTDAHTSATVCAPSRAGLISGRYQQRFGFECNGVGDTLGLPVRIPTMGEVFKQAGYQTAAIGKWHLGKEEPYHPNNRGFDYFYGFLAGSRSYFPNENADQAGHPQAILRNNQQVSFSGYLTDVLGEQAVKYIKTNRSRPIFMYLSFNAVHTPMEAEEADLQRFDGHARQTLAAMTWSMDKNIGRVVDALQAEQLLSNTIIFFLSDNGGATNNQSSMGPLKGWKGNKYEGGHRVPFLVSWSDSLPAGQRYDGLTSALDIFPTALAAAGIPPVFTDGVNLLPFIRGEVEGPPHQSLFWRKDQMAAARIDSIKLIRLNGYGLRMYNLEQDLGETTDLVRVDPKRYLRTKAALNNWEESLSSPKWLESQAWNEVTFEIHQALMENREPNYINPRQMNAFKEKVQSDSTLTQ